MNSFMPYPKYRQASAMWFGEIPEHWELLPNRAVFQEIKDRDHPEEKLLSVTISKGIIRQTELLENSSKKDSSNQNKSKYKLVKPDDIAYNKMRAWQGAIGVSTYQGIVSPAYIVVRTRRSHVAKYFHYLFRIPAFAREAERWSYGITSDQWSLRYDDFKRIYCTVPPKDEQALIVQYLDYHEYLIRNYIYSKRKVIDLLNEQKQTIIQRAVICGLDSSARLKSTGADWLGDIPIHWEALRSRFIFREIDKRSTTGREPHLSMSQKLGLVPSSMIEERRLMSESYVGAKICEKDDIVLNRLKAHLGVFALAPQQGLVSPDYTIFRSTRKINSRYFELLLRTPACRVELRKRAKGIVQGFWRLYTDDFYDIRLSVPPIEEQDAIVAYLDDELRELNQAIKIINDEVELVREYRARLISDVVTGKLDVREAAKNLPEIENLDIPESTPIEDLELSDELEDVEVIEDANE